MMPRGPSRAVTARYNHGPPGVNQLARGLICSWGRHQSLDQTRINHQNRMEAKAPPHSTRQLDIESQLKRFRARTNLHFLPQLCILPASMGQVAVCIPRHHTKQLASRPPKLGTGAATTQTNHGQLRLGCLLGLVAAAVSLRGANIHQMHDTTPHLLVGAVTWQPCSPSGSRRERGGRGRRCWPPSHFRLLGRHQHTCGSRRQNDQCCLCDERQSVGAETSDWDETTQAG